MLESNSNKCQLELREQAKLPITSILPIDRGDGARATQHKARKAGRLALDEA